MQQVLNGLTLGSIYGLVALGLTLVYGILHVPNFAHGALYMVGAYVSYVIMVDFGANYWLAMLGAAGAVALLAVLSMFRRPLQYYLKRATSRGRETPEGTSRSSWPVAGLSWPTCLR